MAPREVQRLRAEMEELFSGLSLLPRLVGPGAGFRPSIDVYRTQEPAAVVVILELAGLDPAEVELSVADEILFVRGRRGRPAAGARQYHHMEIEWGPFERRVALPEPVDSEQARATYTRGFLTIVLPVVARRRGAVTVRIVPQDSS
jgi:HSP20 family protein